MVVASIKILDKKNSKLSNILDESVYCLLDPSRDYDLVVFYNGPRDQSIELSNLLEQKLREAISTKKSLSSKYFPDLIVPKDLTSDGAGIYRLFEPGNSITPAIFYINKLRFKEPNSLLIFSAPEIKKVNNLHTFRRDLYTIDISWALS